MLRNLVGNLPTKKQNLETSKFVQIRRSRSLNEQPEFWHRIHEFRNFAYRRLQAVHCRVDNDQYGSRAAKTLDGYPYGLGICIYFSNSPPPPER